MDITIIGTGNMGKALTTRAVAGGHRVNLLGTAPEKARGVAEELSADVRPGTVGDPITGDVVVLAVWYPAVAEILARYSDPLDGKVIVDITNPIDPEAFEPLKLDAGSGAQEIAAKVPGAKVVKAFNTTFAGTLTEGQVGGQPLDIFLATDDEDAKAVVSQLVRRWPATGRCRPPGPGARIGRAGVPAHGTAGAARHRIRQHHQGPVMTGARVATVDKPHDWTSPQRMYRSRAGQVVMKIRYCGSAEPTSTGSRHPEMLPPAVFGHEWTGTVVATGTAVGTVAIGQRVTAAVGAPYGTCAMCRRGYAEHCDTAFAEANGVTPDAPRRGGFATHLAVSERRVVPVLAELSDQQAGLVEPTAVTFHAVKRTAFRLGRPWSRGGPIGL